MTDTRRWPARDERLQWMAIAVLTVIAIALRVYRLTEWSLHDDEYSTWKNSLELSWSNPRPLLFALNHYLVWPLFGLRELGLRLIPVTAGVVAVPAFYVMLRRVNMGTEGLAAAALVAVSTWHVYWSQFARYYTLVFLLSAVCGLALLGWLRNRRGGWLGLAAASGVLATLAHPSALPVVGTGALIVGLNEYRNNRRLPLWSWALALGIGLIVAAVRYGPIIAYRSAYRESACCHTGLPLAFSLLDWMTAPVLLCALVGMALWWWTERGTMPLVVAACALIPTVLFIGMSELMVVSLSYLFATTPFYFLAAGWLIAHIARSAPAQSRASLAYCGVAVAVVASANLVGLASHFRDCGRLPYRDVANALPSLTGGRDTILAEGTHLEFYLPQLPLGALPWDSLTLHGKVHQGGAAWVLVPRVDRAGFGYYERQFAQVYTWVDGHCALVKVFTTPRLDFRRNALELFRCVPEVRPTALSGAATAAGAWSR